MENGSGLSRIERMSAGNLAALLQAAWRSAVMPEFIASMPVAAVDGTMRRRLRGEAVAGQAHIKTGLLADAALDGGLRPRPRGRRQVVVMIVNHRARPKARSRWTRCCAGSTRACVDPAYIWIYIGVMSEVALRKVGTSFVATIPAELVQH